MAIRKWKATRRPERALEVGGRNDPICGDPTVLVFDNMGSTFFLQFHSFTTQTEEKNIFRKNRETKHQDDELEYHEM